MKKAFTFLDVCLALLIVGVVVVSIYTLNIDSSESGFNSSRREDAVNVAEDIINSETCKDVLYIENISRQKYDSIYDYDLQVSPAEVSPGIFDGNLKKIVVTVYFKNMKGDEENVKLTSYKSTVIPNSP